MSRFLSVALVLCLFTAAGQNLEELSALRKKLADQEKQIDALKSQLSEQKAMLDRLIASASPPAKPAAPAPAPAAKETLAPLSVQLGGIQVKPGGFLDLAFVHRDRNLGSGLPTSFSTIPFADSTAGHLTDGRLTAQNSRLSLTAEGAFAGMKFKAFAESDFLGNTPPNLAVAVNPALFRLRHFWVNVSRPKWELLGGQAWTLLTANRTGAGAETSNAFVGLMADPNHIVGMVLGRDPQLRLVLHPSKSVAAAVSLEAADQFSAGSVVYPSALSASYGQQINNGSAGITTTAVIPDIAAKIAYDTRAAGHAIHLEATGLLRTFRVWNPVATRHFSAQGYGGGVNANVEVVKNLRLFGDSFLSQGGGRYIFGLGPDLAASADGSLHPVKAMAGLTGFEYTRPAARSTTGLSTIYYGYLGAAYFGRTAFRDTNGSWIGFGFPGSGENANRVIRQIALGVNQTAWKSPNHGALRVLTQYSYFTRNPWWMPANRPRNAPMNMVIVSFRYELP